VATHKLQSIVKWSGEGLKVEGSVRNFKIVMDEPPAFGGKDNGMNPLEAVLTALGGCLSIVVVAFSGKLKGGKVEDVWVEVEGEFDPDGFMHKNESVRKGFSNIRVKVHIKSDAPEENLKEFLKFVHDTCPVGDTLENPVPLSIDVVKEE